jgi:hypothetical protein
MTKIGRITKTARIAKIAEIGKANFTAKDAEVAKEDRGVGFRSTSGGDQLGKEVENFYG